MLEVFLNIFLQCVLGVLELHPIVLFFWALEHISIHFTCATSGCTCSWSCQLVYLCGTSWVTASILSTLSMPSASSFLSHCFHHAYGLLPQLYFFLSKQCCSVVGFWQYRGLKPCTVGQTTRLLITNAGQSSFTLLTGLFWENELSKHP